MSTPAFAGTSWSRPGKQLTRAAAGLCALALASSVLATPGRPAARALASVAHVTNVQAVALALDGVRFQDVFDGVDLKLARAQNLPPERRISGPQLMPNLHRLMREQGAVLGAPGTGQPIAASGPDFVSLPGYSEMLTGRRVTGCESNACSGTEATSIADEIVGHAAQTRQAAVVTSWPDISRVAARNAHVAVSSGRNGGATRALFERTPRTRVALWRGESEQPWPGHGDFRRDRFTSELALSYLEEQAPSFLLISLGEPDEFAHQGNYAGYLDSLQEADAFIGRLAAFLEEQAAQGTLTALFITADHGRASNFRDHGKTHPESARVWLVATGSVILARGAVSAPVERRLADIIPTVRRMFGLPPDTSKHAGNPLTELLLRLPE